MGKAIEIWGESDVSYKVLLIIWRSAPSGQGRQENADKNPHLSNHLSVYYRFM